MLYLKTQVIDSRRLHIFHFVSQCWHNKKFAIESLFIFCFDLLN